MNITELIVDFVQQGNTVEFPGLGTLTGSNVSAYHDTATGTFYPARRTVVMNNSLSGNKAIIRHIAEKECVTNDIAEQMWNNYIAALSDKLHRSATGHEFPGLGRMLLKGSSATFEALPDLDLDANKKHEQPLEHVATYTPKAVADPFAAFDKPAPPAPTPEPEPVPEPTPAPSTETETVTPPASEPVVEDVPPIVATPTSAADHLSEVKRMLDEIPSSPKDAREKRLAEKAAAKAEKEARKAAEEAEKAAARKAELAMKDQARVAKEQAKAAKEQQKLAAKKQKQEKKENKKRRGWLWILVLLLLLLLGFGAYYYFTHRNAPSSESIARDVELSYKDQFTEDRNLLTFEENDINRSCTLVHNFMADYIHQFLLARHYGNAFAPVMNQVDQYANERLHELMVEGYCVKRFFPYEDFWLKRNYAEYKEAGAQYYRCKVQGELMNLDLLDGLLDDIIVSLGLHADGYGLNGYGHAGANGGAKANANKKNDQPYVEVVPDAPTFRNSKQGFDIIAGFFTSKKSANKCANQLKALGSDAYIISKSGGYYVSMGSAPTYTAAQAMEKYIKSWYKSDVTIKNFNE